jgi:hypothetical protein
MMRVRAARSARARVRAMAARARAVKVRAARVVRAARAVRAAQSKCKCGTRVQQRTGRRTVTMRGERDGGGRK